MNERMKKMVSWLLAFIVVVGAGALLFFWYSTENARTRDARILAEVRAAEGMLETYRQQYAAYPGARDDFVGRISALVLYEPLAQDDASLCEETRCPNYRITYTLETNVFESKGAHTITPLLPTQ